MQKQIWVGWERRSSKKRGQPLPKPRQEVGWLRGEYGVRLTSEHGPGEEEGLVSHREEGRPSPEGHLPQLCRKILPAVV